MDKASTAPFWVFVFVATVTVFLSKRKARGRVHFSLCTTQFLHVYSFIQQVFME